MNMVRKYKVDGIEFDEEGIYLTLNGITQVGIPRYLIEMKWNEGK